MGYLDQMNNQKIIMKTNNEESISHRIIFIVLIVLVLFIESIIIIFGSIFNGILRKEVLSKESKLGFDINIIMK